MIEVDFGTGLIQGLAIYISLIIIVAVGSLNDWAKDK
jgi:hypothetical protein